MRSTIGATMKVSSSGASSGTSTKRNSSVRRRSERQAMGRAASVPERIEPKGGEEKKDRGKATAEEVGRRYDETAMERRTMQRSGKREERIIQSCRAPRFPRLLRLEAVRMRKGDSMKPRVSSPSALCPSKLFLQT